MRVGRANVLLTDDSMSMSIFDFRFSIVDFRFVCCLVFAAMISPEDLYRACMLFEQLSLKVRLKQFKSGERFAVACCQLIVVER